MDKKQELNRRELREEIIKKLYQIDINKEFLDVESEYEYVTESIEGVLSSLHKIDEIIINNLVNWRINRLSFVDRAIIRFAVYELYYTDTPYEIVINEALNLTRKYTDEGDSKQVSFTNKVLDNIKKYLKK
ncbi:MAG: transcription antitermination factor NusB [Candidatus Izimaplasma sp.]|nr:transcription antitermination factor NusB [Candidatus Izimaplasma bacterium]